MMNQKLHKEISEYRSGIMGISIVSIMLFHQYFVRTPFTNFFHSYGYWGVDVFLFLSGMGLVRSIESYSLSVFYKRRILRIIPPCFLCGLFKCLILLYFGPDVNIIKEELHMGVWSFMSFDLWYIDTIIIYYVLSPLFYKFLSNNAIITSICVLFLYFINGLTIREWVGYNWFSAMGIMAWSIERLPVFLLGMFLAIRKDWFKENYIFISMFFLFIAFIIVVLKKFFCGTVFGINAFLSLSLAFGVIALVFDIIILLKILPKFFKNMLFFMGAHSLEIYLIHEFIFAVFYYRLQIPSIMKFVMSLFMSLFLAYLCKKIVGKIGSYSNNNCNRFT